ncbi:carbohydrate-binding protein [Winogradskyella alexanderae]|uniref:Carbohydrate-binding protein n=1 Tax=Winogradskyella alexanderae TaxID=2877123 RepID=A0ABS7XVE4_9FLAO|nr:carbohydrate-binding protein [Winogradskyella alexanderae]MCA0133374.1 carbohydrate-binding protein [Winogradskyella alexanderae]
MMKSINYKTGRSAIILGLILIFNLGCERDLTDEAVPATFPNTAEIFTDTPVGLTDDFFISFDPADGANPQAFNTDDDVAYQGTTSIRFDVPTPSDPNGSFIGGIFKDRGEGRDLTGYDALTFWAKATVTADIERVGFGADFEEGNFVVRQKVPVFTNWRKVIVPIPDPSKLTQEKGMFLISTNSTSNNNQGFTIWIDEVKFEKLGTTRLTGAQIFGGQDLTQEGFVGIPTQLDWQTFTTNLADGQNLSTELRPNYFEFSSSNPQVATVSEDGLIEVVGLGETLITASLNGVMAQGSLNLNVASVFSFAPVPTRPAENVVSLFSDAYNDIPVSRYNSFFEPFQTTLGGVVNAGTETIISYTDLNFVGIVFNDVIFPAEAVTPVDATNLTHLHIDILVPEALQAEDRFLVQLTNYGATESVGSFLINGSDLVQDGWASFDIPLSSFAGLTDLSRIGLLLFNTSNASNVPTISSVILDNIYFYAE